MDQKLYGLSYEFTRGQGHYLVLSREEGISDQDLSRLALKILTTHSVPGLLPMKREEWNWTSRFVYDFSGKRMLSAVLAGSRTAVKNVLRLLLEIAAIVEESPAYMLAEKGYLLHQDFIFCGKEETDLYLVYVPLKCGAIPPLGEQFAMLVTYFMGKLGETSVLHKLAVQAEQENWGMEQWRIRLNEMILTAGMAGSQQTDFGEELPLRSPEEAVIRAGQGDRGTEGPQFDREKDSRSGLDPLAEQPGSVMASDLCEEGMPLQEEEGQALFPQNGPSGFRPLSRKQNLILALPLTAGAAWLWSRFAEEPSEAWLYINSGMTLLMADAAFLLSRVWRPSLLTGNRLSKVSAAVFGSGRRRSEGAERNPRLPEVRTAPRPESGLLPPPEVSCEDAERYYQTLANKTTLLSTAQATVPLTSLDGSQVQIRKRTVLEIHTTSGKKETVPLGTGRFLIGRADGGGYVCEEAGVSRAHAEIWLEAEGYYVKDLGSRNGSFLNGEFMVPYKPYPFRKDDTLAIVNTRFLCRVE